MSDENNNLIDDIENNEKETTVETELTKWQKYKAKRAAKKEAKRIKEAQKSLLQNVFEMVAYIATVVAIALIVKNYIGQPIIVQQSSMTDTLYDGDAVWCNKVNYTPERFDVVILKSAVTNNEFYIKRVIGLPGETIYMDGDDIFIKASGSDEKVKIDDKYGFFSGITYTRGLQVVNTPDGGYKIGDDEYFVMGDNRYNSKDSRIFGAFKKSEVKGHALFRIWPLTKIGDFDKSNEK